MRLGFEQKRDRYNGFDASEYSRVVDKFERAEKLKEEAAKKRELEKKFKSSTSAERKEATAPRTRPTRRGTTTTTIRAIRIRIPSSPEIRTRRVHEGEQTRAHGGGRRVDDGSQPADPRGHRQVPAQP